MQFLREAQFTLPNELFSFFTDHWRCPKAPVYLMVRLMLKAYLPTFAHAPAAARPTAD